jgi:hypothetical protein
VSGPQVSAAEFFARYEIRSLRVSRDADIRAAEASLVDIFFAGGFRVSFKLLEGEAAQVCRYLEGIGATPRCEPELTPAGRQLGPDERAAWLCVLLTAIGDRVAKIHKEQSILNIRPVGKRFLLYGKTQFDVLSDGGEGQLAIRILRADGSSDAALAANDLLDGLYAGIITQAENRG